MHHRSAAAVSFTMRPNAWFVLISSTATIMNKDEKGK